MNDFRADGTLKRVKENSVEADNAFWTEISQQVKSEQTAVAFTKNLLTFIVGRKLTVTDMQVVDLVVRRTAGSNYKTADILAEIIRVYFRA